MNAPPFPTNPTFNQQFGNWVWSGSRWVCTNTNGVRIVTQVFRASAPYTPSPGLITAVVETWGSGGAGGEAAGDSITTGSGGGGGSGGYSKVTLASGLVLGGVNVTVPGTTPNTPRGANGYAPSGASTSFGAFCVANGGQGGQLNDSSTAYGDGGAGGALGVGDIAFSGSPGVAGTTSTLSVNAGSTHVTVVVGGAGGSMWGGGGQAVLCPPATSLPGYNATDPAGGGSGASVNTTSATPSGTLQPGGTGGAGMCVVTEYCWADTIDDGCGCGPTSGGARVAITGQGWQGGFDND
jgi:hypothetical protein